MQIKFTLNKNSPYLAWRLASIVVIGLMCGSIITACYFMYQNIYRVLDDANTIIVLNATDGSDNIDLTLFNKTLSLVNAKVALPPLPAQLRNIFVLLATSTPTSNALITPSSTISSTPR